MLDETTENNKRYLQLKILNDGIWVLAEQYVSNELGYRHAVRNTTWPCQPQKDTKGDTKQTPQIEEKSHRSNQNSTTQPTSETL